MFALRAGYTASSWRRRDVLEASLECSLPSIYLKPGGFLVFGMKMKGSKPSSTPYVPGREAITSNRHLLALKEEDQQLERGPPNTCGGELDAGLCCFLSVFHNGVPPRSMVEVDS